MNPSGRPIVPISSQTKIIEPMSKFDGIAHAFLPHERDGFGTKVRNYVSDSYVEIEVDGYTAEERAEIRRKLELEAEA